MALPDSVRILNVDTGDVLVDKGFEGRSLLLRKGGFEHDLVDHGEGDGADEVTALQLLRGGARSVGDQHPGVLLDDPRHWRAIPHTVSERFGERHRQDIGPFRHLDPRIPPTEERVWSLPDGIPLLGNEQVLTFLGIERRRLDAEVIDVAERSIVVGWDPGGASFGD